MPLYEYYCKDCDGVFELIRPVRQSTTPQPCPECDREVERLMSVDVAAFTVRDGLPRRIPDRGTYWHMGKEVSRPVNEAAFAYEHPDIHKEEVVAPSNEEVDAFNARIDREIEQDLEADARGMYAIQPQRELQRAKFLARLEKTGGLNRLKPRGGRRKSDD
jgi:putative FmdB family regulatory protein